MSQVVKLQAVSRRCVPIEVSIGLSMILQGCQRLCFMFFKYPRKRQIWNTMPQKYRFRKYYLPSCKLWQGDGVLIEVSIGLFRQARSAVSAESQIKIKRSQLYSTAIPFNQRPWRFREIYNSFKKVKATTRTEHEIMKSVHARVIHKDAVFLCHSFHFSFCHITASAVRAYYCCGRIWWWRGGWWMVMIVCIWRDAKH